VTPPRRGARRAGVGVAVALALATGCTTAGPAPSSSTGPSSSTAPQAPATDGETPAPGPTDGPGATEAPPEPAPTVRLASGDVVVDVEAQDARVETDDEGAATLTVAPGPGPAVLVLTTPGSFAANADGTVTVLDEEGTLVGGLTAPRAVGPDGADGGAAGRGARLVVSGPTRVEVTSGTAEGTASGTGGATDPGAVTTTLGTTALRSAVWGEREGGRSLAVDPTAWARTAGAAGRDVLWTALVAAEPEADTPGMHDQLACHALGAPDKATWNLEPWRPDVGLVAVLAARCNPT